jgi:hypothetical protein
MRINDPSLCRAMLIALDHSHRYYRIPQG